MVLWIDEVYWLNQSYAEIMNSSFRKLTAVEVSNTNKNNWMKYIYCILLISLISSSPSNEKAEQKNRSNVKELADQKLTDASSAENAQTDTTYIKAQDIETIKVMVVPCSNGYEYSILNYDFDPLIELELNKFDNINLKPFPLKTLLAVSYLGVFDRKYCPPIIEKIDVDYLILTRFQKRFEEINRTSSDWGYEVRIVNARTLEQVNSLNAYNLKGYKRIEKHIKDNIAKLKSDIENFKNEVNTPSFDSI